YQGEIVVFKATQDRDFIKRIIATAGDEVMVERDGVYVNGERIEESYILELAVETYGPTIVPEGTVFVMGDNRKNSLDSRQIGFVDLAQIKGKAMFIFWPFDSVRTVSHP
ncbi:MAG: signal peptidase I, partial [Firmicutes bacterium]|nr:signal peptidase I [Bacillota bacterium]